MHESRFPCIHPPAAIRGSAQRTRYRNAFDSQNSLLTWEQLNFPDADIIKKLCMMPRGLVLVTGPTGSGKTTTLATLIDYNQPDQVRPPDYPGKNRSNSFTRINACRVTQREIGVHLPDFNDGIRRALRMDPDIILVGEMRDYTTIKAATTAAETGHLVFGTLHTQ